MNFRYFRAKLLLATGLMWLAMTGVCWGVTLFYDDFSTDMGWAGYAAGQWARGPTAFASCAYGDDPANDHSASSDNYILGYILGGCYPNSMPAITITSPVIDCTGELGVQLRFYRVLGVERAAYDHATIEIYDGSAWSEIYHNPVTPGVDETEWSVQEYDVSAAADDNPNFQVRYTLGPTDSSVVGAGWNIDDFEVYTLDDYCVSVEPPSSSSSGAEGSVVVHEFNVTNCGIQEDTISLSVSGETWFTEITDTAGTPITDLLLTSGSSQAIQVRVTVGTEWNDSCVLNVSNSVKATSVDVPITTLRVIYYEDFETDPVAEGWTGFNPDQWEWGPATASSGCSGNQDPSQDHSPTADNNIIGYDIGGCYTNSMPVYFVTSPPIDLSGLVSINLSLWRFLGVESATFDHASVEVSRDGSTWNTVWEHTAGSFSDANWTHITYDLQGYLDGQPAAQFRFGMGPTDSSVTYCGWNIDDIALSGLPAAFLEGTVTDDLGPIENALVVLDGTNYEAYTNASGFYHIEAPIGTYSVTASAAGHNDATVTGIELFEGLVTTQDFVLTYPDIMINPDSFDVTVNINATRHETLTITNEGNGLLEFTGHIQYLDARAQWDLLADINATTPSTDDQILCGEFANGMLWVAGGGGTAGSLPNSFHRFQPDGTYIDSIPQGTTSDWGYFDLTSDGTYLYGADANGVYQIDTGTGAGTMMFANPVSNWPLGIAYISDSDTFIIHAWFDAEFVEVTRTGTVLRTFNLPLDGMFGLTYDNMSAGGPFLWLFDQTGTVTPASVIYQVDISTPGSESLTGFTYNLAMLSGLTDQLAGGLFMSTEWFPGLFVLGGVVQGDPNDKAFALEMGMTASWLSIDPTEGEIEPPPDVNTLDIDVLFDASEVDGPGDYQANIIIDSNDGDESSVSVPVIMHVIAPYWATIEPEYQEGGAEAGYSALYTVTINNIGETDDTYDVGVVSSIWAMSFPGGSVVAVPHGESRDFTVSIDVPPGTIPGATDTGVFSVTSQGEPAMVLEGEVFTTCSVSIGSIGGSVTRDGAIPILGALVEIEGTTLSANADEDGIYLIENVPVGTGYTVNCSAPGYNSASVTGVAVVWHETTTVNFDLLYPEIDVAPLIVNHQMDPDQQQTLTDASTIYNLGTGLMDYEIDVEVLTKQNRDLAILLVSDPSDGSTSPENYDTVYMSAITGAGYSATMWNHDTQGSPTLVDLEPYDVVIWYTGVSGGDAASSTTAGHVTLTLTEEATLTSWLDLGGKSLCLSGMWIAWNCIADATSQVQMASALFDDYIQLTYPIENFTGWIIVSNTWTLIGQGGPIGGTDTWPVNWVSAENYPDQLEPNNTGDAIFNWNSSGTPHHNAGILYDGGTFRTVLLACPLESIGQDADKIEFVSRMLDWFGEITSSWLEVDPEQGEIDGGMTEGLDFIFDTTGMAEGNYSANVHIMSNDGDEPDVVVQVNLAIGNVPTVTPPPPTNTPGTPTNTPVPPTNTPIPPTSTPVPPTNTPIPPTDTPSQPTETPPPFTPTEPPVPTDTPPPFTPTEPPVPTDTPIPPTETPTPECTALGTDLEMPAEIFSEGDLFYLTAHFCNTNEETYEDFYLFVIIEIEGAYWFYPGWSQTIDFRIMDFPMGLTTEEILPQQNWPAVDYSFQNVHIFGAVTNPEISEVIGDYAMLTMGWTAS